MQIEKLQKMKTNDGEKFLNGEKNFKKWFKYRTDKYSEGKRHKRNQQYSR